MAHVGARGHGTNHGAGVPLTVLSVAYPLARASSNTAGGAEQILLALDRALVERGHKSLVLAAQGSQCQGLLVPVPLVSRNFDQHAKMEARARFAKTLRRTLDRHAIDVVHMHGIDFHGYLPQWSGPIIVTLHLPLAWYAPEAFTDRRPNIRYVCVSRSQARTAPSHLEISEIIPNGVDLSCYRPRGRHGNYVLIMGRICPEKGTHLGIEAAQRQGETVFVAGTVFNYPEHWQYFEEKVRPKLSERVRFLGAVGGNRKADLIAGAKCLLLPSLAPETSSLVAMEALASGTPVIAWRSGALNDIIAHGRTGFLVSSKEEMTGALSRVEEIRRSECRREAERRFSSEQMLSRYFELYAEVTKRVPGRELQAA